MGITKRADGRYRAQVFIGRVDGKNRYRSVYGKTQKEANAAADELRAKMKKGLDPAHDSDSFAKWAEMWLKVKSVDIGASQHQSYEGYIKHLNYYIGDISIKDIKIVHIQTAINELYILNPKTNKPSSKKTLSDIKNTASQIFRFAIENNVIDKNPVDFVKVPKNAVTTQRRALTTEEQERICEFPHRMQTAAMIMMYAGLRRGELIPLTWDDINIRERTITVNKAVEVTNNKSVVKSTKTASGLRIVTIPQKLADYLRTVNITKNKLNLVCPSLSGSMYTATNWKTSWNTYLLDMDVVYGNEPNKTSKYDPRYGGITMERITPHMLRHTFCTIMYFAGVDVLTACKQMGHSDVKTTLSIYTHLDEKHKTAEMSKLDDFLSCTGQIQVRKS